MTKITIYLIAFIGILLLAISINLPGKHLQEREKLFIIISFIILWVLSAFRGRNVGTDTSNYLHGFYKISKREGLEIFNAVRWESGYVILNKIAAILNIFEQQIILVMTSSIILFCIFYFLYHHSTNKIFSIYLYITLFYYFSSFNLIRQTIAIAILLLGYKYIEERKFVKYLSVVLIATMFHEIAFLSILLYFLYGIRLNIKNTIIIIITIIFVVFGFDYLIQTLFLVFPYYSVYIDTDYFQGGGILTTIISLSVLIFGLFIRSYNKTSKEYDFLLVIMILSLVVSILSMQVSIFNRLDYYFNIYHIIFIPLAINNIKQKKQRILFYYVVIAVTLAYFAMRLITNYHGVVPYKFFFEI